MLSPPHSRTRSLRTAILLGILLFAVITLSHPVRAANVFSSNWETLHSGPGPIRSITRASNNDLLGLRSTAGNIQLWRSSNEGANWSSTAIVASSSSVAFGDPMISSVQVGGQEVLFAAYREEHTTLGFSVRLSTSTNGGSSWNFAGTIHDWTPQFVGAPFLFQLSDGTLQAYYDSEVLPATAGQPGNQWIGMKTGTLGPGNQWSWGNELVASRSPNLGTPTRDGLASVVMLTPDPNQLGNDRIMLVTEGISSTGGLDSNVVRSIQSFAGGKNQGDWDFNAQRQTVYESPSIDGTGRRYNAYSPYAIRVGNGPVMVAFSTDEDRANESLPADLPNTPVENRHSHIKWVRTLSTFEDWSSATTLWDENDNNYGVGLFERSSNDVVASLDLFGGVQKILVPAPDLLADFNVDLDVDGSDFLTWQRGFGILSGAQRTEGDANVNGTINALDLTIWKTEFGSTPSPFTASIAIPEPTTMLLAVIGLFASWKINLLSLRHQCFR